MRNALWNKFMPWGLGLLALVAAANIVAAAAETLPFAVYTDDQKDTPWIASGYMGDTGDIAMDPKCTDNPKNGKTCLKVEFKKGSGWGGVAWQNPANDWGDQPGGRDLTGAKKLTFWVRGAKGGEKVSFGVGLIGADKKYPDSAKAEAKDQILTTDWKQITIDLKDKDLKSIKTGFYWTLGGQGDGVTFYLDDIQFE